MNENIVSDFFQTVLQVTKICVSVQYWYEVSDMETSESLHTQYITYTKYAFKINVVNVSVQYKKEPT